MLGLNACPLFAEDMLDKRTYGGEIGQTGKQAGQADNFVFQNGQFESTLCSGFGYGKSDYKATATSGVIQFTAETRSKDGAFMSWAGTVKGKTIEGTVATTEKVIEKDTLKDKTSESWFKGTLK